MKISIISDEISFDFHTAFELGQAWGCMNFELRKLGPDRIPDHDPVWDEVVGQYIADGRANITALSPGLFKLKRSSETADSHINARFKASLDLAIKFKCPRIIIFAFLHEDNEDPADPPPEVIETLQAKADQAAQAGIELSVETSQGSFARNGAATRILLDRIGRKNVTTNWDPTNAITDGDTSPLQGFDQVAGTVGQVHIKDTRDGGIIVVGEGVVDWAGHLAALDASGFSGYLTLETHLKPRLTETRKCLDNLRKIAGKYLD